MLLARPTKANVYHLTKELGMCCVCRCMSSAQITKGLRVMGMWGCVGGMPSVFAEVFVLLFFFHIFSLHTLLTISNVQFLFEHLFTYCAIDSDLKRASFILLHSLLGQFDSVFL